MNDFSLEIRAIDLLQADPPLHQPEKSAASAVFPLPDEPQMQRNAGKDQFAAVIRKEIAAIVWIALVLDRHEIDAEAADRKRCADYRTGRTLDNIGQHASMQFNIGDNSSSFPTMRYELDSLPTCQSFYSPLAQFKPGTPNGRTKYTRLNEDPS
jgi:hypothetical protein